MTIAVSLSGRFATGFSHRGFCFKEFERGGGGNYQGGTGIWGRGRHRGPKAGGTWGPWQDTEGWVEWTVARIQGAGGGSLAGGWADDE